MLADVHLDLGLWSVDASLLVWYLRVYLVREAIQRLRGWRFDCRRSIISLRNCPGQKSWYGRQYLHGHPTLDFDSRYVSYRSSSSPPSFVCPILHIQSHLTNPCPSLRPGFFINYAANAHLAATRMQYRLVQAIPLIPCGLAFIASFFLSDTPRWLASEDRTEEAMQALAKLRGRGHEVASSSSKEDDESREVRLEYAEILNQCQTKEQQLKGSSFWAIAKDIASNPSYRERFFLGAIMQTIAQWSGGNGITYYIPQVRIGELWHLLWVVSHLLPFSSLSPRLPVQIHN